MFSPLSPNIKRIQFAIRIRGDYYKRLGHVHRVVPYPAEKPEKRVAQKLRDNKKTGQGRRLAIELSNVGAAPFTFFVNAKKGKLMLKSRGRP